MMSPRHLMKSYLGLVTLLCIAVAISACGLVAERPADVSTVRQAISDHWAAYVEAAKGKDADGLISIWAPDMRLLSDPGGAEYVRSAEEHRRLAEAAFATLTVVALDVNPDEVNLIDAKTALELGRWSEEFAIDGQSDHVRMFGAYMGVWKRQPNGEWLLHRFIRNRHDFANPTLEDALNR